VGVLVQILSWRPARWRLSQCGDGHRTSQYFFESTCDTSGLELSHGMQANVPCNGCRKRVPPSTDRVIIQWLYERRSSSDDSDDAACRDRHAKLLVLECEARGMLFCLDIVLTQLDLQLSFLFLATFSITGFSSWLAAL
jgi:hypothetical protein